MSDPWTLIASGRLEEAVAAYSEALQTRPASFTHRNRATALLLLGRCDDAFRDIEAAEALEPPSKGPGYFHADGDQVRLGVIEWLLGKHQAAGDRWLRIGQALLRGRVVYSDASGGVGTASILRFGAARLARPDIRTVADKLIGKIVKRPHYRAWPLPIGGFYLGQVSASEVLGSVSDTPILRDRQLCQAQFAIAVTCLEASDTTAYQEHMQRAASSPQACLEKEFFLASRESGKGGGA